MTEAEWLACADPRLMHDFLAERLSERKLRLIGCACLRRIWYFLSEKARRLVEKAEHYADGDCSLQTLQRAAQRLCVIPNTPGDIVAALLDSFADASLTLSLIDEYVSSIRHAQMKIALVDLTREMFGNPFQPVALDSSWLAWNDGAIRKMAQAIYDGRRFADLPILADALEDAGCADAAILAHCRTPGEHVRGCWVIDLLLGKS